MNIYCQMANVTKINTQEVEITIKVKEILMKWETNYSKMYQQNIDKHLSYCHQEKQKNISNIMDVMET